MDGWMDGRMSVWIDACTYGNDTKLREERGERGKGEKMSKEIKVKVKIERK